MQHIAGTARGRLAQTQQDLLKIAMNQSKIQEEHLEHPICSIGFAKYGEDGVERMDDTTFFQTIMMLFKSRPSSRFWDVVPDAPYTEDNILIESPEGFKMSFQEKAEFLRDEFLRRPKMVGFKIELFKVDEETGQSMSLTIYESVDELVDPAVPVSVTARYRTNF